MFAPTPYTAADIRNATKSGRTYRFRVEEHGKPVVVRELRFDDVDDEGANLSIRVLSERYGLLSPASASGGTGISPSPSMAISTTRVNWVS